MSYSKPIFTKQVTYGGMTDDTMKDYYIQQGNDISNPVFNSVYNVAYLPWEDYERQQDSLKKIADIEVNTWQINSLEDAIYYARYYGKGNDRGYTPNDKIICESYKKLPKTDLQKYLELFNYCSCAGDIQLEVNKQIALANKNASKSTQDNNQNQSKITLSKRDAQFFMGIAIVVGAGKILLNIAADGLRELNEEDARKTPEQREAERAERDARKASDKATEKAKKEEDENIKKGNISVPSYEMDKWKESTGDYIANEPAMQSEILFSDGVRGVLFVERKGKQRHFVSDSSPGGRFHYQNLSIAIKALYIYKKYDVIMEGSE